MYTVISTVGSSTSNAVSIQWYKGGDALKALVAAGQAMEDPADMDVPASIRFKHVLSVRIDISENV